MYSTMVCYVLWTVQKMVSFYPYTYLPLSISMSSVSIIYVFYDSLLCPMVQEMVSLYPLYLPSSISMSSISIYLCILRWFVMSYGSGNGYIRIEFIIEKHSLYKKAHIG